MSKRENQLKALDALTVYMAVLIISALVGVLGYRLIGLWALYLCEISALAFTLFIVRKTGLKGSAWLKFAKPSAKEIVASAMIFAGALLCAIPILLFVQIIVPNFAISSFHITEALEGHSNKFLHIILLIIISSVSDTLIFEGYIYTRMKSFASAVKVILLIAAGYAVFQLDLYTLVPIFILELAVIFIRKKTKSLVLPLIFHLMCSSFALAVKDFSTGTENLLGARMGAVQTVGLFMVFAGAAIPVLALGARLMGELKNRSLLEKALLVLVALILLASGYAISRMG